MNNDGGDVKQRKFGWSSVGLVGGTEQRRRSWTRGDSATSFVRLGQVSEAILPPRQHRLLFFIRFHSGAVGCEMRCAANCISLGQEQLRADRYFFGIGLVRLAAGVVTR